MKGFVAFSLGMFQSGFFMLNKFILSSVVNYFYLCSFSKTVLGIFQDMFFPAF